MAKFYRYETVEIPITFTPSGILEGYSHIIISLFQAGIQLDKTEEDLEIDTSQDKITLVLNQEETSLFVGGEENDTKKVVIQVNIYYNNNKRSVSTKGEIYVYDNLYDKVIIDE